MPSDPDLTAERLARIIDQLRAEITALRVDLSHANDINTARLNRLESETGDHETRIRAATEGVTQFKLFSGLASGSSVVMAAAAFLKAILVP